MGKKRRREHDRLSALPDATLIRILSHLPTDEAVRTNLLSRRWRRLYAAVPVVDLVDPKVGLRPRNNRFDKKPICFEHKVTCALLGRDTTVPIRALRLDAFNITRTLLDQCVVMALASGAEELDVKLRCYESSRIRLCPFGPYVESSADFDEGDQGRYTRTHPHIFRSATLRRLSLARWTLEFPQDVSFMSLETLVLRRIMAPAEELQRLISSCPRLLDLTLEECPGVKKLTVTSACLQSFAMVCCHKARRVVLDTRRLRSLHYKGGIPRRRSFLSVANHGALAELTIDICQGIHHTTQGDVAPVTDLIGMCTNLTFLHLALRPAMAYYSNLFSSALRRLPRLRRLELKGCLRSDHSVRSVAALLQNTPNLEALSLFPLLPDPPKKKVCYFFFRDLDDELRDDYDDKEVDYTGQVQEPEELWSTQTCFKHRLRRISVVGYRGRPLERVLAKFLLSKVEALEELSVSIAPGRSAYRDETARELASWRFNPHTRVTCV